MFYCVEEAKILTARIVECLYRSEEKEGKGNCTLLRIMVAESLKAFEKFVVYTLA